MNKSKKIGLLSMICLVAGNMIGAGAYVIPSVLAKYGSFAIIGWLVSAFGAIFLSMVFAWLSQWNSVSGGPYAYTKEVFGDFVGYQMAVSYWIMGPIGSAGLVVSTIGYISTFCPIFATDPAINIIFGLALIWGFTLLNFFEIKVVTFVQIFGTVIKVIPLILLGIIGVFMFDPSVFHQQPIPSLISESSVINTNSSLSYISAAAAVSLWSFIGLESGTVPANQISNPRKTIPRATIIGVLIVALIYIMGCIALMIIIPQEILVKSAAPYVDAVAMIFCPLSGSIMAVIGIIGLIFSLNGWIFIQGYTAKCAAEDNLFPKFFLKTNKNGAPIAGLIFGSTIMSGIFLMGYSNKLVDRVELITLLGTYATIVPYLYCSIAVFFIALRKNDIGKWGIARVAIVSTFSFLYTIWIIIGSGHEVVYAGSTMLFIITPFYFLLRKKWLPNKNNFTK